jgi:hypothetical protein
MENKKSLVEEAIIQIKNLEEAVAENAKGILHSTMKEEINQLVKESLTEQEEDSDEIEDTDVDLEDMESDEDFEDMEDDETDNLEDEDDFGSEFDDEEEPVIDLTGEEDTDEVLRVFQLMGPNDEIIVQKDNGGNINLKDKKNNTEYMIVGESEEEFDFESQDELYEFEDEDEDDEFEFSSEDETDDDDVKSIIDKVFSTNEEEEDEEDLVFEIEMEDGEEDLEDGIVYEIEMDDEDMDDEEEEEEDEESYDLDSVMESKSFKAKGLGLGNPNKKKVYSAKPNQEGGFKTVKKTANKTMGTGNAKKGFTYKDGENLDGEFKVKPKTKKVETKEAARTYGNGSKSGRGLRKGITPNRNLNLENVNNNEVNVLREKNEEYRQALNVFRDKLTEVAVFNSNLAYATRLFTEHTTTKNEKINILKRFDSVETIKESKNLYHVIKDELSNTKTQPMNESIERTLNSNPSTGSAVNLIESKTYENPQFLRMKDLMSKLR